MSLLGAPVGPTAGVPRTACMADKPCVLLFVLRVDADAPGVHHPLAFLASNERLLTGIKRIFPTDAPKSLLEGAPGLGSCE